MVRHLPIFSIILASLCPEMAAQEIALSSPSGYYDLELEPGYQTVGVAIVNPAEIIAGIETSATATLTLTTPMDVGALLDSGKAYYVELTGGPAGNSASSEVGQRFDVDTAATAATGEIRLDMSSSRNTAPTLPYVAGYTCTVREHVTLNQIFDKSKLHYSTSFADADQVQFFDGSGFSIYYLYGVDGQSQWLPLGGFESQDQRPLAPGEGFLFKRSAKSTGAITLRVLGEVRTTPFVQPLAAGFNFVSEGYPLALSFEDRLAYGAGFSDGDKMKIFDGSGFVTYRLYNQGTDLVDNIWVLLGDPSFANQNANVHFNYRGATFFETAVENQAYRIDAPFSN